MKAFKCDRCGNYFRKNGTALMIENDILSEKIDGTHIDLCSDCWAWFENHLNGKFQQVPEVLDEVI